MRAILTWHSIDDSGSAISVSPGRFQRQLDWLQTEGVRVVSLDELVSLPGDAAATALTFDDGIATVLTQAAPALEARGWIATVFVVTQRVGTDNSWRGGSRHGVPTFPLLGWDALADLQRRGWVMGSHTRTHPRLPRCGDGELDDELGGAAGDLLGRLGDRPRWLAYPYGAADGRVARRAAAAYQSACTTELRPLGGADDRFLLPRIDAWYLTRAVRSLGWASPGFRRRLGWHRGLRALRARLP